MLDFGNFFGSESHFCHLFKNKRIFNRLETIFAPTERAVSVNEDCGTVIGIYAFVFEALDNYLARIQLVFALNLCFRKPSCTGNGTV